MDAGSNPEEATQRQTAAHRRDAHRHAEQDERETGERDRCPGVDQGEVVGERIDDQLLAEEEKTDGDSGAEQQSNILEAANGR